VAASICATRPPSEKPRTSIFARPSALLNAAALAAIFSIEVGTSPLVLEMPALSNSGKSLWWSHPHRAVRRPPGRSVCRVAQRPARPGDLPERDAEAGRSGYDYPRLYLARGAASSVIGGIGGSVAAHD
jgi:hypothetical protein